MPTVLQDYVPPTSSVEILARYAEGERYFGQTDIPDGADFRGVTLEDACFDRSFLSSADFRGANLKRVSFRSANVKCSNFRETDLEGATFEGASVEATDFAGANLSGVSFVGMVTTATRCVKEKRHERLPHRHLL